MLRRSSLALIRLIRLSANRQIQRFVATAGIDAAAACASALPRPLAYQLADVAGFATFYLWPRGRRNALRNFAWVLGREARSPSVRRTAKGSFRYYARMAIDVLRQRRLDAESLRHSIRAEGLEHLDAALARGKGAILVAPHLGNWETAVSLACFVRHRVLAVSEDGFAAQLVAGNRDRAGIEIVPRSKSLRPLLRALSSNSLVILVCDLAKDMQASEVDFFGLPSRIPVGPALLARRTGAALVPIYAIRDHDQRTLVRIEPPVAPHVTDDQERDVQLMSQWIADFFARVIRANVVQWYPYQQYWSDAALLRP